jgi:hypothetical protein
MNTALANTQNQLLLALWGAQPAGLYDCLETAGARQRLTQRGLQAYQANGQALAERALAAAYPVLAQLIGEESFASLARHIWTVHPPQRGDVAYWGAELAEFLAASSQLADEPFLPDVARIEWALHRAATAADCTVDAASFALLTQHAPTQIGLRLASGVFLCASCYPVVSMIHAHQPSHPAGLDLNAVAALLAADTAEYALVWRQGFKPQVCALTLAEYTWLTQLHAGASLNVALDAACSVPVDTGAEPFDFQATLLRAVQNGWLIGAELLRLT